MTTALLWDLEQPLPKSQYTMILWRSYGEVEDVSIPRIVEDNAAEFREKLLTWIYSLGEMKVKDKRIVEHLELRPGFSYWWMTLLAGKRTHMKTPRFYDAVRLFALAKYLQENNIEQLRKMMVEKGKNPYIHIEIENARTILINSIREVKKDLYMSSIDKGWTVVLIFNAEKLLNAINVLILLIKLSNSRYQ